MANISLGGSPLTYNPARVEIPKAQISAIIHDVDVSDGEAISFEENFDNRWNKLIWYGFPGDHTAFAAQLSTMEALVGTDTTITFGSTSADIGYALNVYKTQSNIKVIALDRKIRKGGRIIFDSVELVFRDIE